MCLSHCNGYGHGKVICDSSSREQPHMSRYWPVFEISMSRYDLEDASEEAQGEPKPSSLAMYYACTRLYLMCELLQI